MNKRIESFTKSSCRRESIKAYLLFLIFLLFSASIVAGQEHTDFNKVAQDIRRLELGKPIERKLQGSEVHAYQAALAANQYLHIAMDQSSLDVVIAIIAPNGKLLSEIDTRFYGLEQISVAAKVPGNYRLQVRAFEKDAPLGNYGLWIEKQRNVLPEDDDRIAAEKITSEGKQLLAKGLAEDIRRAREKYEQAVPLWHKAGDRYGEALALNGIGFTYIWVGQLQQAKVYHEQALALYRAIGNRFGEGEILHNLAAICSAFGDKKKAIELYEQALVLRRAMGDRQGEGLTLSNFGGAYFSLGELQKAKNYFDQALTLLRTVNDRVGETNSLNGLAAVYMIWGQEKQALEHLTQALTLSQTLNNRRAEAHTRLNLGQHHALKADKQKAREYYDQALTLFRKTGDRKGEAGAINNIAALDIASTNYQTALGHLQQTLEICRSIEAHLEMAQALANMAYLYDSMGEKQQALTCYNQALPLFEEIGDRRWKATTLSNIGGFYLSLGDYKKALHLLLQALPLIQEVGDRRIEAIVLQNLGNIYIYLGNKQLALDYLNQALALSRALKDRYAEFFALHNLGYVYDYLGSGQAEDRQKAFDYYNEALKLERAAEDKRWQAQTLFNLSQIYYHAGDTLKALNDLTEALRLSREEKERSAEATILHGFAFIERGRKNFTAARKYIESAIAITDSLRLKVASPEWRSSYFASVSEFYAFYIDLLMQLHQMHPAESYDAAALQVSEQVHARSLLEILGEAHADIRHGVDSVLVKREQRLQHQINAKEQSRMRMLNSLHTEAQIVAANQELETLLTQLQEVQAQIRANSPRYAALTQPQPLSTKEIQTLVLDDDTMLLEYSLGDERSFLWAVTPTTLHTFVLPERAEIDSLARRVHALLTARNQNLPKETARQKDVRVAQADLELQKSSATLSQILLEPVAKLLGNKRLLIVSDGALQYIPFGVLPVPANNDKRPLLIDHEIVNLPSASVLAVLRREIASRRSAPKLVAILADPVFTSKDPRAKTSKHGMRKKAAIDISTSTNQSSWTSDLNRSLEKIVSRAGLRRLVFSGREADGIMQLVPIGAGMKAVGFAANRATATNPELGQYRVVHFATHSLLDSEHPELSGIVMSLLNEKGEEQDGFLRLHDIYNLNLASTVIGQIF